MALLVTGILSGVLLGVWLSLGLPKWFGKRDCAESQSPEDPHMSEHEQSQSNATETDEERERREAAEHKRRVQDVQDRLRDAARRSGTDDPRRQRPARAGRQRPL